MDSRYSAEDNIRAAKITYVPGGTFAVPDNAFGDGNWTPGSIPSRRYATDGQTMAGRYADAILPLSIAATQSTKPYATLGLFDGVPDANPAFMNQRVTSKRKSYLPPEQFPVFQPYPDPPVTWKTWVGAPSRFDMR